METWNCRSFWYWQIWLIWHNMDSRFLRTMFLRLKWPCSWKGPAQIQEWLFWIQSRQWKIWSGFQWGRIWNFKSSQGVQRNHENCSEIWSDKWRQILLWWYDDYRWYHCRAGKVFSGMRRWCVQHLQWWRKAGDFLMPQSFTAGQAFWGKLRFQEEHLWNWILYRRYIYRIWRASESRKAEKRLTQKNLQKLFRQS